MESQSHIYPPKEQGIESMEERIIKKQRIDDAVARIIENPETKEEAQHNREIQERIKKIKGVF